MVPAKIVPTGLSPGSNFGFSRAMNKLGTTIAVAGPNHENSQGSGVTWAQQGNDLTMPSSSSSIVISGDGTMIAVGVEGYGTDGGLYIYTVTGTSWSIFEGKIVGTGSIYMHTRYR